MIALLPGLVCCTFRRALCLTVWGLWSLVVVVVFWVLVVGGFWLVVFGMLVGGFYVGVGCGIVVF